MNNYASHRLRGFITAYICHFCLHLAILSYPLTSVTRTSHGASRIAGIHPDSSRNMFFLMHYCRVKKFLFSRLYSPVLHIQGQGTFISLSLCILPLNTHKIKKTHYLTSFLLTWKKCIYALEIRHSISSINPDFALFIVD